MGPHRPILDISPHSGPPPSSSAVSCPHPPKRTLILGSSPLSADRPAPRSPRTSSGVRPPRHLESEGLGTADGLGPDPDRLLSQRRRRPRPHSPGRRELTQE